MKEMEFFQADRLIEALKSLLNSIFVREIVACFKRMGGIEADPHSVIFLDSFNDFFDLFKGITDLRSLSCCVLQKKDDVILHLLKSLIDPLRNSLHGLIYRCPHSVTDMDDQILGSQMIIHIGHRMGSTEDQAME